MGFYGADIQQLKDLAGTLNKEADRLDFEIVKALSWTLFSSPWDGVDAIEFRAQWTRQIVPALAAAAGTLREAATRLSRNSDEQEKASVVGGKSEDRGKGKGKKTTVNPEGYTEPRGKKYGHDRDMLDLALAAYYRKEVGHEDALPAGWHEVSSAELNKLGINPAYFGKAGDSFNATLYRSVDGQYALSFEGTDPKDSRDWAVDAAGGILTSHQVVAAMNAATVVKEKLAAQGIGADRLTTTGHSLGGELAAVASMATGCKGVTFNAAGVSGVSQLLAKGRKAMSSPTNANALNGFENVTAYSATADPLSNAQDKSIFPNAYGKRILIDSPGKKWDPVYNHMGDPLKAGIDKLAEESGGY